MLAAPVTSVARIPAPGRPDREAADVALLAGPAGGELLAAVLAAEGLELAGWAVHQVHHRPGVGVTVGWHVTWRLGERTGAEYLLGTTAPADPSPASTTARLDGRDVVVWRHPADPALPGLAAASSADWVGAALGAGPDPVAVELVTYRPLRRAVLRVRGASGERYLKVVRPHVADALHARHELLAAAGLPVARAVRLGDGVLTLDALVGTPMAQVLADGAAPRPGLVTELLDRLPSAAAALPRRPSPADRVLDHAAATAAVLPERAAEVARLAGDLAELLASADPGPTVATHGDLNPANLLLDGDAVVGLLDVDTLGPGSRADDLAGLLGHLSVLPVLAPATYPRVPGVVRAWTRAFDAQADPVALRARTAAVVLSLVPGAGVEAGQGGPAVRAQAGARLAVARSWWAAARRLRDLSSARPRPLIEGRDGGDHHGRQGTGRHDAGGHDEGGRA